MPCRTIACSRSSGATSSRRSRPTPCRRWSRTCVGRWGATTVERQGSGYVLRVDPDTVDATRLDRLVQAGRDAVGRGDHTAAGDQFRAAVALVRGAPLADLVDRWFARDAASRLQELVLAAQEGLADAELATGHHADVLAKLHELIVEHPTARAVPGPADRRPVPLRSPGRCPRRLPRRPGSPAGRAGPRPGAGAEGPRTGRPRAGPGPRRAHRRRLCRGRAVGAARGADVVRRTRAGADRRRRHARPGPPGDRRRTGGRRQVAPHPGARPPHGERPRGAVHRAGAARRRGRRGRRRRRRASGPRSGLRKRAGRHRRPPSGRSSGSPIATPS